MKALPILFAALTACVAAPATSQESNTPVCDTLQNQTAFLAEEFGEVPFISTSDHGDFVLILFVNPDTESWTEMYLDPETKLACYNNHGFSILFGGFEEFDSEPT